MTYKASIVMPYAKTFVRLKLTDLNENLTYTEVIETRCGIDLPIKVSPNPVIENYFVIDNPSGEIMSYELTDLNGKVLLKGRAKSVHHTVTLASNLSKGMYHLHVEAATGEKNFKLNVK